MRIAIGRKPSWLTWASSAVWLLTFAVTAEAGPCVPPPAGNPIACENANTGNPPSEWDIVGNGNTPDVNLVGFATAMSVNKGQTEEAHGQRDEGPLSACR